jgi:hypothetical protein
MHNTKKGIKTLFLREPLFPKNDFWRVFNYIVCIIIPLTGYKKFLRQHSGIQIIVFSRGQVFNSRYLIL